MTGQAILYRKSRAARKVGERPAAARPNGPSKPCSFRSGELDRPGAGPPMTGRRMVVPSIDVSCRRQQHMNRFLAAAALSFLTAWAPVTLAQTASPPASAGSSQRDFNDTDLKSFATALVQVSRINDNYLPIYRAAKTPEEQQAVEQKASQEMVQAVEGAGMSVAKYHEILGHARDRKSTRLNSSHSQISY